MEDVFPAAVFLLLFFSCSTSLFAYCADEDDEKSISNMKRVRDKIFKDYDKTVRPQSHYNDTTKLYFSIAPFYVVDLDEEKSLFSMDSWFVLSWTDKRLRWNASLFEGIAHFSLAQDEIWKPDLRVHNAHSSSIDPMKSKNLYLNSDGMVWWVPSASVTTFCDVTTPVDRYPYDKHECNITVQSWTHHAWDIDFNVQQDHHIYWDYFSNTNPRWEVNTEDSNMHRVVRKYNCCLEPYMKVDTTIILKRRPPSQIQVVWTSSVLVMMLTLTMFWIPSDSGRKITLGASLLIILTALTIYSAVTTRSPRATKFAVASVQATMIVVSAAVLSEIAIINLARRRSDRKPPDVLMGLLSGTVGTYMCVWTTWRISKLGNKVQPHDEAKSSESADRMPNHEWLMVATGCDRILFLIFIVVFAVIQHV